MKLKTFSILALLIIFTLLAWPVMGQESTQEAPEVTEVPPITVIIESPNEVPQDEVSQSELLIASFLVLSLLFNAVQAFWGKGSIPPNVANEIFAGLRVLANTTKTEDDNKLIDAGEAAYNALMPKATTGLEERPRD